MFKKILQVINEFFLQKGELLNTLTNVKKGKKGEAIAIKYLKSKHKFVILAKNWRHGRDEIDIIAEDGGTLVFVEVKAQQMDSLVPAYYRVDKRKKKALCRACKAYIYLLKEKPKYIRFDIVEVKLCNMRKNSVNYYKNIPLFNKFFHA